MHDGRIPYQLFHVAAHSPTGFNCGYLGSGPADLALSILVDYLGEDPQQALAIWRGKLDIESRAVRMHQRFKQDVICHICLDDDQSYNLSDEQVGFWLGESV